MSSVVNVLLQVSTLACQSYSLKIAYVYSVQQSDFGVKKMRRINYTYKNISI